jgi:L-malate glycosyltransferase
MSNAILEAMACGIPALANAGCGSDALITDGENGWISDLGTPGALAAALMRLLTDPQALVDMGRRARLISESRFSMTAMLDAYEQHYRRLAAPDR